LILVSACLLGVPCRHDGAALPAAHLPPEPVGGRRSAVGGETAPAELPPTAYRPLPTGEALLPVCPEELGGLPTPRPASQLHGGDGRAVLAGTARVRRADGTDVTAAFIRGAEAAARLARKHEITIACLKSRSPSCGVRRTHVEGQVVDGMGVTAAALSRAGVRLIEAD